MSRKETLEARTPADPGLQLHLVRQYDADPVVWLQLTQKQSEEPKNLSRETRGTFESFQMFVNCPGVRQMDDLPSSEQSVDTAG